MANHRRTSRTNRFPAVRCVVTPVDLAEQLRLGLPNKSTLATYSRAADNVAHMRQAIRRSRQEFGHPVNTSKAAFPDLRQLIELFYDRVEELATFENVQSGDLPVVYSRLLDHDHHMTVTLESHHGCSVDVQVLESKTKSDTYHRKILLTRQSDNQVVMFGIVRLHTRYLSEVVRSEIESQRIPLGRVLIDHDVLRRVELGKLWRVRPSLELQRHFQLETAEVTFGRTAIIHCDEEPAIELVEIVAPEVT